MMPRIEYAFNFVPDDTAPCRGHDPEVFFTRHLIPYAKRICAPCPLRSECLAAAMRVEGEAGQYRYGVYGGLSADERGRLAKTGTAA
jgi:hypothetical protein